MALIAEEKLLFANFTCFILDSGISQKYRSDNLVFGNEVF
jgi:hypothetical protein